MTLMIVMMMKEKGGAVKGIELEEGDRHVCWLRNRGAVCVCAPEYSLYS